MSSVFPVEKEFPIPGNWPDGLEPRKVYEVLCDDKGRDGGSFLQVFIADDGDVHVSMQDWEDIRTEGTQPSPFPSIRVRTLCGGGRNSRTRLALLWLAKAIQLDNQENGVG
jgi:hypothetical protein